MRGLCETWACQRPAPAQPWAPPSRQAAHTGFSNASHTTMSSATSTPFWIVWPLCERDIRTRQRAEHTHHVPTPRWPPAPVVSSLGRLRPVVSLVGHRDQSRRRSRGRLVTADMLQSAPQLRGCGQRRPAVARTAQITHLSLVHRHQRRQRQRSHRPIRLLRLLRLHLQFPSQESAQRCS